MIFWREKEQTLTIFQCDFLLFYKREILFVNQ